jgi:D-arabinose 1-dehydrogenase-like Zn-dependent alcohol dehydrogenase
MYEVEQKVWVERPNGHKFVGRVVQTNGPQVTVELSSGTEVVINPWWDDCRVVKLDERGVVEGWYL